MLRSAARPRIVTAPRGRACYPCPMAHHERRRPKHQRAGCLLCKPHKESRFQGTSQRAREEGCKDDVAVELRVRDG
jgi:hypothetical protein